MHLLIGNGTAGFAVALCKPARQGHQGWSGFFLGPLTSTFKKVKNKEGNGCKQDKLNSMLQGAHNYRRCLLKHHISAQTKRLSSLKVQNIKAQRYPHHHGNSCLYQNTVPRSCQAQAPENSPVSFLHPKAIAAAGRPGSHRQNFDAWCEGYHRLRVRSQMLFRFESVILRTRPVPEAKGGRRILK